MARTRKASTTWKEQRRFRAIELKRLGWKRSEIAAALGVTKGAVSQWMHVLREHGAEGLRAQPHPGRPPELTSAQKRLIPEFLWHGAEAYGFRGEVWTCSRVSKVIEWELGVSYHKSHVARVLKDLHWTPQLPIEQASQRDESEIVRWRDEVWPEVKKKLAWSADALFLWMNRASICCPPWCARMRLAGRRPSCGSFKPTTIWR